MATADEWFAQRAAGMVNTVGGALNRGLTSGLGAGSGIASMSAGIAQSAAGLVSRTVAGIAIRAAEGIATGASVIGSVVDSASEKAQTILQTAIARVSGLASTLTGGLSGIVSGFVSRVSAALSAAPALLMRALGGLARAPGALLGRLGGMGGGGALSGIGGAVGGGLGSLWRSVSGVFGGLAARIPAMARAGLSNVGQFLTDALAGAGRALGGALSGVVSAIGSAASALLTSPVGIIAAAVALGGAVVGIGAALQKLGAVVVGGISRLASAAAGVLTSGWTLLTSIAVPVWAALQRGYTLVAGFVKRVFDGVGSALGAVFKFAQNAVAGVMKWFKGLGGLSGIGSGVGNLFGAFITTVKGFVGNVVTLVSGVAKVGLALAAMGLFAKVVWDASQAAMEFAKAARGLQATSGLSFGASWQMQQRNRALGVSNEATSARFGGQPAGIQRMMSGAWGLPGADSGNFNAEAAAKFQAMRAGGMMGQIMANAMAKSLHLDDPASQQMLMMKPGNIRSQQNYSDNINSRMGNTPGAMAKFAEEIPLLLGRVGAAFDAVKMAIARNALPVMEKLLNVVTNFAAANAGNIGGWIESITEWVFTKAPVMLASGLASVTEIVSKGLSTLFEWGGAALEWGAMIVSEIPDWLGIGVAKIGEIMVWMATAISKAAPVILGAIGGMMYGIGSTIQDWTGRIADFMIDMTTNADNPVRSFVVSIARGLDTLIAVGQTFARGLATVAIQVPKIIDNMMRIALPPIAYYGAKMAMGYLANSDSSQSDLEDAASGSGVAAILARMGIAVPRNYENYVNNQFNTNPAIPNVANSIRSNGARFGGGLMDGANNLYTKGMDATDALTKWLNDTAKPMLNKKTNIGYVAGTQIANVGQTGIDAGKEALKKFDEYLVQPANVANAASQAWAKSTTEESLSVQYEQLKAIQKVETAVRETNGQGGGAMSGVEVIARIGAYIAQDSYAALSRAGG